MAKTRWDDTIPARGVRRKRYTGCSIYIDGLKLQAAWGDGPIPKELGYRLIPWGKRTVLVRLEDLTEREDRNV